jgi:uncharacterized membrane protein YeaQ/YmgE (transglycosylase-associated protein family)
MGIVAAAGLQVAAVLIAFAGRYVDGARSDLGLLATAILGGIGGYVASEYLGTFSAWGPEVDGMFVLPALVGAVILAAAADTLSRMTGEPAL